MLSNQYLRSFDKKEITNYAPHKQKKNEKKYRNHQIFMFPFKFAQLTNIDS